MWLFIAMVYVIVRLVAWIIGQVDRTGWRLTKRKIKAVAGLFVNNYVDGKMLFVSKFGEVASLGVITQIDATAAYALLKDKLGADIVDVHQVNMYDYDEAKNYFTITILELTAKRMIEIGNGYVEVLYTSKHYDWAMQLLDELAVCKAEVQVVEEEKAPTIIGFARAMEMN